MSLLLLPLSRARCDWQSLLLPFRDCQLPVLLLSPTMIRAIVKSTGALVLIPTAVLDTTIPTTIQEITDATGVATMLISMALMAMNSR